MPLFRRKPDKEASNGGGGSQASLNGVPPSPLQSAEEEYEPHLCVRTKSRLSKTLEEVLQDAGALAYLLQFAEEQGTRPLVKFWLEAQSFHASCLLRQSGQGEQQQSAGDCAKQWAAPNGSSPHQSLHLHHSQCLSVTSCPSTWVPHGADSLQAEDMSQATEGTSVCVPSSQCVGAQDCVTAEGSAVHANGGAVGAHKGGGNSRTLFTCNLNGGVLPPATSPRGGQVSHPADDITTRPGTERRDSLSQDAMHIYNTYIAQNAPLPIGVPDDLRSHIRECVSRSPVEPECFFEAQQFAVGQMEKDVYPHFLRSPYHCKHQVDVLTSGNVSLADILYNDSALFYFMEFMEQEQSRHLVDFLLMADNFRGHLLAGGPYDPAQAQDDAMVLYDKYFSLQATSPLGFSDAIRLHVEQNICREEGPLPSCFDRPVLILMQHLEKNHLRAFLSSQLYVKYISECIVTIQTAQSDTDSLRRKKRSGSDSSNSDLSSLASQPSTVATNTLLAAADGRWPGRLLRHIEGTDMKIDSGQFNPDALWKRSLAGKLQMAHVDHLGKLTTEFEPEPDKKTGSNLTKALRKLVNWDADKTEEDMAWQVAEMIVKDICSVTLCPSATSDDVG